MNAAIEDVARADFLELLGINESTDNVLRIDLRARLVGPAGEAGAAPLCYALRWRHYIAYAVRAEIFAVPDNAELLQGYKLVQFSKSRFLDYIRDATMATDVFRERLRHYGLFCRDHVIDVVSAEEPVVEAYVLAAESP